ncbi:unnamed protein product [Cuscuta epithymum]|uniref:Uncharacterized protein n=1 Tax=Cuscuta epithymum TaxID=186058 RepID=A0AAV0DKX0_9ASTE|nr:unnamed protein product [Cuscuta epithymum]CAH9140698.1 unnamed protein product [Cuscuta epithymum]
MLFLQAQEALGIVLRDQQGQLISGMNFPTQAYLVLQEENEATMTGSCLNLGRTRFHNETDSDFLCRVKKDAHIPPYLLCALADRIHRLSHVDNHNLPGD